MGASLGAESSRGAARRHATRSRCDRVQHRAYGTTLARHVRRHTPRCVTVPQQKRRYAVYTNLPPAAPSALRRPRFFAVASAMDDWPRLCLDPFELRRPRRGRDPRFHKRKPEDVSTAAIGLAHCSPCRAALAAARRAAPEGDDWLVGRGMAMAMHDTAPPTEHRSTARLSVGADGNYHLAIGTCEFGNGTSTVHGQVVASVLETTMSRVRLVQSDTDRTGYDTGAFASTGTSVAVNAVRHAAEALREQILDFASEHSGASRDACRLDTMLCAATTTESTVRPSPRGAAGQQLESSAGARRAPQRRVHAQGSVSQSTMLPALLHLQSVHAASRGRSHPCSADWRV